jgi:hypothetical protein
MNLDILRAFLPQGLLENFEIIEFKELGDRTTKKDCYFIYLDEKNIIPLGLNESEFESKGFSSIKSVQDFPIRGKAVYLLIRTRRWRHKENKSHIVKNNYRLVAEGSKLTEELSAFLKGTGRKPRRYD